MTADGERLARVEEQVASLHGRVETEFALRDRATEVQAAEIERVRGQQNEWRQTVTDLTADKVDRQAWEQRNKALDEKIEQNASALGRMLPREVFDRSQTEMSQRAEALAATVTGKPSQEEHNALAERVKSLELGIVGRETFNKHVDGSENRIKALEDWKNRAMGAAVILTLVSGAVGAAIAKAVG